MTAALIAALAFTVALLVTTTYFILGSIPLLVLQHDTPLDARFVRGFFDIYYRAAFVTAAATGISFGLAGRPDLAAGALGLAVTAVVLRQRVIPRLDALGARIEANDASAIRAFRKAHVLGILVNIAVLAAIVWALIDLSRQFQAA